MSLSTLIQRIRTEQNLNCEVPDADPSNGNECARFLFVLEAPGPQAVASGFVSLNNNDQTARNLRNQLEAAGINTRAIALWNVVPWYLGNADKTRIRGANSSDVQQGLAYLSEAVSMMPKLEFIVLVGGAARQAHIHLSSRTTARILSCHHPSPRVQSTNPRAVAENIEVFRHMAMHGRS